MVVERVVIKRVAVGGVTDIVMLVALEKWRGRLLVAAGGGVYRGKWSNGEELFERFLVCW
jgi:hypothetical protein